MRVIGRVRPGMSIGLGVFDGVHRGHREIVRQVDAILTLFPHPDRVLGKSDLTYLTSLREMSALVPHVLILRFSNRIALLTPDVFLDWIKATLKPTRLVVGDDFRFGARQSGTPEFLVNWGRQNGIDVTIVPMQCDHGVPIKSTHIRTLISQGDVETACALLGHPFPMFGTVIRGRGAGKSLGFPTANLWVARHKCLPGFGVYNAMVRVGDRNWPCILYIGRRPTLGYGFTVEVHIPHFDGNLYGNRLTVWIDRQIRGEIKFTSRDGLMAQIATDITAITVNPALQNLPESTLLERGNRVVDR